MVLNLIRFHQDLRSVEDMEIKTKTTIKEKEMDMALKLIDDMSAKWNPEEYKDEYEDAIMKRIEAKAKKIVKDIPGEMEEKEDTTNVVDIMALLQQSVDNRPKKGKAKSETVKSEPIKKVK